MTFFEQAGRPLTPGFDIYTADAAHSVTRRARGGQFLGYEARAALSAGGGPDPREGSLTAVGGKLGGEVESLGRLGVAPGRWPAPR